MRDAEIDHLFEDPPDGLSAGELAQFYKQQAQRMAEILSNSRNRRIQERSASFNVPVRAENVTVEIRQTHPPPVTSTDDFYACQAPVASGAQIRLLCFADDDDNESVISTATTVETEASVSRSDDSGDCHDSTKTALSFECLLLRLDEETDCTVASETESQAPSHFSDTEAESYISEIPARNTSECTGRKLWL